jgi:hypothetical protein
VSEAVEWACWVCASIVIGCGVGYFSVIAAPLPSAGRHAPAVDAAWFVGGTLHDADGKKWRMGAEHDRLATAADYLARQLAQARLSLKVATVDDLKPYAIELEKCVTETASGKRRASETAERCMTQKGWIN